MNRRNQWIRMVELRTYVCLCPIILVPGHAVLYRNVTDTIFRLPSVLYITAFLLCQITLTD